MPRELFLPLPDFAGLGERFAECSRVFDGIRAAFFDVDLLKEILRFAFALGAADFDVDLLTEIPRFAFALGVAGLLAWAFFFFDLGII